MFAIQSIMLVSLGFLLAVLLAFLFTPIYWGRAVRLTTERLRRSLPMSEAEIRASKDGLRAQHALCVQKLETRFEAERLCVARQKIDINRRDAKIVKLQQDLSELNTKLEASKNARHVLEQTIMDRVPRIETQLAEARDLLSQRDQEVATLQAQANKTFRALDEAMQINLQQRAEIDHLNISLSTQHAQITAIDQGNQNQQVVHSADVLLRKELEELRARTREQDALIYNLQPLRPKGSDRTHMRLFEKRPALEKSLQPIATSTQLTQNKSILASDSVLSTDIVTQSGNIVRELKTKVEAQQSELEKLRAALKVFEESKDDRKPLSVRDMRITLKARVASLEKETAIQEETIRNLRSELAASHDHNARQAAYHMNELRRLSSRTFPTTTSVSQHVQERKQEAPKKRRKSLSDRIAEKVPTAITDLARSSRSPQPAAQSEALNEPSNGEVSSYRDHNKVEPVSLGKDQAVADDKTVINDAQSIEITDISDKNASPKRGKLIERISGVNKT